MIIKEGDVVQIEVKEASVEEGALVGREAVEIEVGIDKVKTREEAVVVAEPEVAGESKMPREMRKMELTVCSRRFLKSIHKIKKK